MGISITFEEMVDNACCVPRVLLMIVPGVKNEHIYLVTYFVYWRCSVFNFSKLQGTYIRNFSRYFIPVLKDWLATRTQHGILQAYDRSTRWQVMLHTD